MVRGFQEKQYQLAAQKRHEADLKFNYYKQTARFFERESEIAKHFNFWNLNRKSPYLEKTLKVEKLRKRQDQLRSLLKDEDERYEKELKELKLKKNQPQVVSIETSKQQLKENKAEQSLYLPRDCRRLQTYFYNTRDFHLGNQLQNSRKNNNTRMSHWGDFDATPECARSLSPVRISGRVEAAGKPSNDYLDSNILDHETHRTRRNAQLSGSGMHDLLNEETGQEHDPKYAARYSRRSLEQTNLRTGEEDKDPYIYQNQDSPVNTPQHKSISNSSGNASSYADETDYQREILTTVEEPRTENEKIEDCYEVQENENFQENYTSQKQSSSSGNSESGYSKAESVIQENIQKASVKRELASENAREQTSCDNYERERSLPWMRESPSHQNLSVQMFRYLAHNDLKRQILDLGKRELMACKKQSWSEALRLRDMRNRLELLREKNLYNTLDLHLSDEAKKGGLASIELRTLRVTEREEICQNSSIYNEDAKDIWEKWVEEDEDITRLNPPEQREILLNQLEEEWKNLAMQDKDRISDLYHNIFSKSELQDEHHLVEAIKAAGLASSGWNR